MTMGHFRGQTMRGGLRSGELVTIADGVHNVPKFAAPHLPS
jgi:hypothetical protein